MSNLLKNSLYGVVVLLALYGVYTLIGPPLQTQSERPPILVSDSSLDFQAGGSGPDGFTDVDGDKKHWRYNHPNDGPKWFTVIFFGGAASPQCDIVTPYVKIDGIKVTYNSSGGTADISVKTAKADIRLSDPAELKDAQWLRIETASVAHVELFKSTKPVASCDPLIPPSPTTKSSLKFIVFQKH